MPAFFPILPIYNVTRCVGGIKKGTNITRGYFSCLGSRNKGTDAKYLSLCVFLLIHFCHHFRDHGLQQSVEISPLNTVKVQFHISSLHGVLLCAGAHFYQ